MEANLFRILSRTMYCPHCHARGSPHNQDLVVLHGSSSRSFRICLLKYDVRVKKRGFSPHLITWVKTRSGIVTYTKACGIVGCGVSIEGIDPDPEAIQNEFTVTCIREEFCTMPKKDWYALLEYKDHEYYLYF